MIASKNSQGTKRRGALLRWIGLTLLFIGTHVLAQTTGTVTYVYTDPQGTPLAEADASGNITATFDYTPYGTSALGTPPNGPGYTGHVNDPETNLVYMQARYYDSVTGHFLSVDPIAPASGNEFNFNRFAYANNNPVLNIDPNGRQTEGEGEADAIESFQNARTLRPMASSAAQPALPPSIDPSVLRETSEAQWMQPASEQFSNLEKAVNSIIDASEARSTARVNPDGQTFTDATGRVRQGSSSGPGQGKRISRANRAMEREASGNRCIYCGRDTTNEPGQPNSSQGDHIQPRAGDTEGGQRGDNSPENTGNSCLSCNASKSNQPVLKWINNIFGG